MQSTYRVPVAPAGWMALVVALVLLALPGAGMAAGPSLGSAPVFEAGGGPLARGAGYGIGDDARRVRGLQRRLRWLGWSPGPIDGLFGPRTEAAVVRFQGAAGLQPDGVVGARTLRALRQARPRPLGPGAGYGRSAGSARVRSLQSRLRGLGLEPGPVDGRFGPRTQAAVMRLQAAAGAALSGVVDAATRGLLAEADRILGQYRGRPGGRNPTPDHAGSTGPAGGDAPGTKLGQSPRLRQQVARSEDSAGSTGSGVPLLLAAAALAGLAGALLARVRAPVPGTSVPLAHGTVAEGRSLEGSIGAFRGQVHALVLGTRSFLRRPQARYLVSDPRKPGPFWVTHGEIDRLVAPRPPAGRQTGGGNGASNEAVMVLGYASVPKTEQTGASLVREQAAAIGSLCEQRHWRLLELVRDLEEPGVKGLDRPGLSYALERVARGEASCLVVSQLRRLSPSAADLGRILESIASNGGRLVAMDLDLDTAAPAGRKAANALIAVGARERERVVERTRKGLEAARAKGHRIGRPAVQDAPALKQRIAAMRASGMTLQAIADRLNQEGVPTLRGGEKWRPSSVQAAVGYRRPPRRWQNGDRPNPQGGQQQN